MIEIRFHGRGGQGAVVASNILADAAFSEGKDVQSFPYFGVERRGAPVTAFTRIDFKPIRIKSQIYEPDYVIVLEPSLMKFNLDQIIHGLKSEGTIIVNTPQPPQHFGLKFRTATVDATRIAIKYGLGSKTTPIVNTTILGAFAKVSDLVRLDSIHQSIRKNIKVKPENNVEASEEAYNSVTM
jgi:2-oxoacid:acceptor oxidoreductase gamma subunit (pyruvate/2-ketoisovalerate family)